MNEETEFKKGYDSRQQEIDNLELIINAYKEQLAAKESQLKESLLLYNNQTETIIKLQSELAAKEKEIAELKAWKESAMSVMPPMQEIGKALGIKLGESIHDKILPGIERLKEDSDRKCIYFAQWCSKKNIYPNDYSLKKFKIETNQP